MTGSVRDAPPPRHRLWWLPNALTLIRLALAPAILSALLLAPEPFSDAERFDLSPGLGLWPAIAAALLAAAGALDWLDGRLARAFGAESAFGQFWDPIADKLVIAAALIGLCLFAPRTVIIVPALVIIVRDALLTLARFAAPEIRAPSQLAKTKTALEFVSLITLLISWPVALFGPDGRAGLVLLGVGLAMLWAAAVLSAWSGATYAHRLAAFRARVREDTVKR